MKVPIRYKGRMVGKVEESELAKHAAKSDTRHWGAHCQCERPCYLWPGCMPKETE